VIGELEIVRHRQVVWVVPIGHCEHPVETSGSFEWALALRKATVWGAYLLQPSSRNVISDSNLIIAFENKALFHIIKSTKLRPNFRVNQIAKMIPLIDKRLETLFFIGYPIGRTDIIFDVAIENPLHGSWIIQLNHFLHSFLACDHLWRLEFCHAEVIGRHVLAKVIEVSWLLVH
jgi:hypothetical protein